MPDYDYAEFQGRPPSQRFPQWIIGSGPWREYGDGDGETIRRLLSALVLARSSVNWGVPPLRCPRLFVSHRQIDDARARQVAAIARTAGFQVWLDAEDADLAALAKSGDTRTPEEVSELTAAFIETALLNSTHVIALITTNTPGSKWVPYEYGRVKDPFMHSPQAACWIESGVTKKDLGEYLLLGVRTETDQQIQAWLDQELRRWIREFGTCPNGASVDEAPEPPPARPPEQDVDQLTRDAMADSEGPIVIMRPLRLQLRSQSS